MRGAGVDAGREARSPSGPSQLQPGRTSVGCGAVVLLLLAMVALSFAPIAWFVLRSPAKALLEELAVPPGATGVTSIEIEDADGTMPEIGWRSFRVRQSEAELRQFYREACRRAALTEAGVESLRLEPDLMCEGRRSGRLESASLSARCESGVCSVFVSVHVLY